MASKRREMTDNAQTIILELLNSGFKRSEIFQALKISPATIHRLLKRYHDIGSIENRH